ncbi:RagB/SusD family nutrient uptake outer membrane protein [Dyadobacter sp. LHD-138]|uniref:RagB/SusD family nutrient uptake outer membrane protein n=1 Tax=Dyadobacter sp. LHD-138 TaxID=3071413 RepID=UPI0027DF3E6A|nr:RagB/SusD family nutrient uptake outer membrane protein [Dyadobacter sp. LHD-138]MDQ6480594.1 RagB/SusD family nutrient uptake outer membrane protein [Dyadobacter sp. LHD-138]
MYHKYIKVTIAFFALFAVSCSDDFLDRYPTDSLNESNFWHNENELKQYANMLYSNFTGHSTGTNLSPIISGDNQSDNMVPLNFDLIAAGKNIVPTTSAGTSWNWALIRSCNYFLARYNQTPISQELKDRYAGEIRFFKVWDYFNKVKDYGDLPWLSKDLNTNSPELFAPRDSRTLVMDSILNTINMAIVNLPAKSVSEPGRINKDVALILKARLCLFEGTFRKYHGIAGGEKFLQEALSASDQLISEGHYQLHSTGNTATDYSALFNSLDLSTNKEVLLYKAYETGLLGNATLYAVQLNNFNTSASKSLVESYLCKDGKPVSQSSLYSGDDSIQVEMSNRDPRLTQTIVFPGKAMQTGFGAPAIPGSGYSGIGPVPTGYQIQKFWMNDQTEYVRIQNGIMDAPLYRYAEVLLINAEANAELGKASQDVINKTINLLRKRAGMPDMVIGNLVKDVKSDFPEIPVLLDEIRRERRVELAIEGMRFDDLLRWKAAKLLNKTVLGMKFVQKQYPKAVVGSSIFINNQGYILPYGKSLPNGRTFDESKNYFLPLPLDELALNKNLTQNPGWK